MIRIDIQGCSASLLSELAALAGFNDPCNCGYGLWNEGESLVIGDADSPSPVSVVGEVSPELYQVLKQEVEEYLDRDLSEELRARWMELSYVVAAVPIR